MVSSPIVIRPDVGSITAPRHLSRVLLPDPEGPIRPTTSPGATYMSTPRSAWTAVSPSPEVLTRFSMRMPSATDRLRRVHPKRGADGEQACDRTDHHHRHETPQRVAR